MAVTAAVALSTVTRRLPLLSAEPSAEAAHGSGAPPGGWVPGGKGSSACTSGTCWMSSGLMRTRMESLPQASTCTFNPATATRSVAEQSGAARRGDTRAKAEGGALALSRSTHSALSIAPTRKAERMEERREN